MTTCSDCNGGCGDNVMVGAVQCSGFLLFQLPYTPNCESAFCTATASAPRPPRSAPPATTARATAPPPPPLGKCFAALQSFCAAARSNPVNCGICADKRMQALQRAGWDLKLIGAWCAASPPALPPPSSSLFPGSKLL